MKVYEITVKTPPIYGRDGSGKQNTFKIPASSRYTAAMRAIRMFVKEWKSPDRVSRSMNVQIVRVQ